MSDIDKQRELTSPCATRSKWGLGRSELQDEGGL